MVYILVGVVVFLVLYFVITFAVESGVYYALIKYDKVRKKEDDIKAISNSENKFN